MSDSLIEQVKRLAEAKKNCWASRWPLERVSDTSLGADTRHMGQVGVTDDGEPIGEVDGGLDPVAEGHKDVLDLLVASLGFDFPALLAHMQAQQAVVDAAREWVETPRFRVDVARGDITPKGLALVAALEKESNAK